MNNNAREIVETVTGARFTVHSIGSNVRITIEGKASQVAQAMTLLYNYHALGEWPEWYDKEAQAEYTFMAVNASQCVFKRGYLALTYALTTQRNGKHDAKGRCARAIVKTARAIRNLFNAPEDNAIPMPDMSHISI